MAKIPTTDAWFDPCITCSSKNNRVRPALCQCKHCSNSFCFDCMRDHNDYLQQNTAYASNRYNELRLLINGKRKLITDETIKSKEQMSEWLRKYIENLTAEKARIDADIERTGEKAQKFVRDIGVQLQSVSPDIEAFTKTSTYSSESMDNLLKKLDELTQLISPLSVTSKYDLPAAMPTYKFEFDYSSKSTTDQVQQELKISENPKQEEEDQWGTSLSDGEEDASISVENNFCDQDKYEPTSYIINCMASDGTNIMYSTINDPQHDIIAYCYLDVNDPKYGKHNPDRAWLLSRIVDMIWWNSIDKFVCATANGIVTVEYLDERFRIFTVVNNRYTNVRVAARGNSLWIHEEGKIMIYNPNFTLLRSVNFQIPGVIHRESFCVTDNLVAFLVIRGDQTRSDILQIQFYNYSMIKMRSFDLGSGKVPCMVRTDGTHQFFIAGGKQRLHIMSSKGPKRTIDLRKEASCLSVVNKHSIFLTKLRSELELVRY